MRPGSRVWYVGHSDGSQLAQLAALKRAGSFGADSIGGVLLYGPSRVGSKVRAPWQRALLWRAGAQLLWVSLAPSARGRAARRAPTPPLPARRRLLPT